jgi:hypothetical protein
MANGPFNRERCFPAPCLSLRGHIFQDLVGVELYSRVLSLQRPFRGASDAP